MRKTRKEGFTLVELMVVAIIVAILAAVAVPLMTANRKRAMATEAEAGCGSVRTALRVYYAEHSAYPTNTGAVYPNCPGIGANDLDGVYFSTPDYTFTVAGTSNYTITATGNSGGSTAPKKSDVNGIVITLNQDGAFTRVGL
jgi:prepilin-type N-terminal cleavage/methylation domain-containing protein